VLADFAVCFSLIIFLPFQKNVLLQARFSVVK